MLYSAYVSEQCVCVVLCLGTGKKLPESLWVRGKTNVGDIAVGVCYGDHLLRRKK